jgi:hypothetical protein
MKKKTLRAQKNPWITAREVWWNWVRSGTDSWGKKIYWDAVFNCDTTTYFFWVAMSQFLVDRQSGAWWERNLLRSYCLVVVSSGQNVGGRNIKALKRPLYKNRFPQKAAKNILN